MLRLKADGFNRPPPCALSRAGGAAQLQFSLDYHVPGDVRFALNARNEELHRFRRHGLDGLAIPAGPTARSSGIAGESLRNPNRPIYTFRYEMNTYPCFMCSIFLIIPFRYLMDTFLMHCVG